MRGFILAAGLGQRLRPVTSVVPKPLLPVGNLPLIGYAIRLLSYHGIREMMINLHHLGDALKESLGDGSSLGVHIEYSHEPVILGTGGGIRNIADWLGNETFVVVNSDTLVDVDLKAAIDTHKKTQALATLVVRSDPQAESYGAIHLDAQGAIRKILDTGEATPQPRMFTGVHVIEPRLINYLPADKESCVIRQGYIPALRAGERLQGFETPGYFADVGTPARYAAALRDVFSGATRLRHADPFWGAAMQCAKRGEPEVLVAPSAVIAPSATLRGPVLVGAGARIEADAIVGPEVVVGANACISRGSSLQRAVVLEGVRVTGEAHNALVAGPNGATRVLLP